MRCAQRTSAWRPHIPNMPAGKGGVKQLEQYFYKCPVCGYTHVVPGYWVSYDPPQSLEQPHFMDGTLCENEELILMQGEEN